MNLRFAPIRFDTNERRFKKKKKMKKLLVSLVVLSVLVGVMGFVAADTQDTFFTATGVVAFSVNPTLLTFPSVTPGNPTTRTTNLVLGADNTEDLTVDIYLTDDSDKLFTKIVLSTSDPDITDLGSSPGLDKESVSKVTINIDDPDSEGNSIENSNEITLTLNVPMGTLPTARSGTITYEVTAPAPVGP